MLSLKSIIITSLLLNLVHSKVPCDLVSVSYCNNDYDDPNIITTTHCSLDECRQLCDNLPDTCLFTEYLHKEEHCTLWGKQFSEYSHQCGTIGAPKDVSEDCDINMDDADNGCSIFRAQDCLVGEIIETLDSLPSWDVCQKLCSISQDCQYWTWERKPKICRLTDSVSSCYRTVSPGGLSVEECQAFGPST